MIETIMLIVVIFVLSGVFWYSLFYQKEKKLLNRLQQMLDCAIDGELERTEVSEEKYSALENSMKQYIDSSFLAGKNQQEQKEVIQKLISDIAHQTLTPISNLKIYGEILSEVSNENQDEIATILEQTEKLDFLIQSLVKLSRMESGIIAVHSEDTLRILPRAGNRTKGQQIDDVQKCTSSICFLEVLPMSIIIFVIVKKN